MTKRTSAKDLPSELSIIVDQKYNYFEKLEQARIDMMRPDSPSYVKIAYLAICAATLEHCLNWIYLDFCIKTFSAPNRLTEAYLSMNFRSKLFLAPVTVSKQSFEFDLEHGTIKCLEQLITRRNKMLHNKTQILTINTEKDVDNKGMITLRLPDHIESLELHECLQYSFALTHFKTEFLDLYSEGRLAETSLLKSTL